MLFSIFELTQKGWERQGAAGDAHAWLPCRVPRVLLSEVLSCSGFAAGSVIKSHLPIFLFCFIFHALQLKGT